ncbi:MFS transporter [Streptomyces sp. SP18BB07]|uniref:MFS transporter n=1 Tax=Streptomyces sp. SP18BB07 TaxID=3002522 RepID=UPI002E77ADE8|nr:MFS transporter [Streptomyces sp. SP18BB07]MEE1761904.1 MFS transporter [Streptomyces sp. SP18BB07]
MADRLDGGQRAAGFPLLTVLALMAGIFAVGSEELVVSPLLPDMSESFDTSVAVMGLSVSVYGVCTAIGALIFAPLGDRVPRRVGLVTGMTVFVLGTLLCASAGSLGVFFAGRALAGLATGAFVPTAYAFVGDQIPYRHRARAMGIVVSSWSLSLVLGVPMGDFVGQRVGWRWTFGLLCVLGVLVIGVLFRAGGRARPEPTGPQGTPDGAARTPDDAVGTPARQGDGGWSRSVVQAFRAPKVLVYVLATFLNMLGFYGMYTYLGSALQYRFGDESSSTSLMILLYGLGFATSFVTGKWADDLGKERVLVGLLAGLVPALAVIPLVDHLTPLLVLCLFLWGAMQSLVVTLLSTLLSECSPAHRGTILAFYTLATNLAVALGAALLGPLFTEYGFSAVGFVCAGITLAACGLSQWARGREAGTPTGTDRPEPKAEPVTEDRRVAVTEERRPEAAADREDRP